MKAIRPKKTFQGRLLVWKVKHSNTTGFYVVTAKCSVATSLDDDGANYVYYSDGNESCDQEEMEEDEEDEERRDSAASSDATSTGISTTAASGSRKSKPPAKKENKWEKSDADKAEKTRKFEETKRKDMAKDHAYGWKEDWDVNCMVEFNEPSGPSRHFVGDEGALRYAGMLLECDWNVKECVVGSWNYSYLMLFGS